MEVRVVMGKIIVGLGSHGEDFTLYTEYVGSHWEVLSRGVT